ncbi:hypothetical protein Lal_00042443 [Lupinus albus]|nr:hypothetical protein Lal_00042443 [Lupinus albus]
MEQSRPKRVKTSATRVRRREVGSPSARDRGDPTIHSFCKKPVWRNSKVGNLHIYGSTDQSWVTFCENRLLHYIIAYILVQRNTNHAQPIVNDLRFIIFISRIVDYCALTFEYTDKDHLVGESLIHKMGIYKYGSTWQYQEDYTTFGLDLSDDDNQDGTDNQHATAQGEPSGSAPQNSAFGFDQLEAMEQRLNNRMDLHFQGLKDSYFAGMEQYEERQTAYSDNQFRELRNLIQSTAEAQNALFCSEFQKLSVLIRGDQNIVTLLITLTILILHLNLVRSL